MRLAIFSDVNANLPTLEAVPDDIAATGVEGRYALGDFVGQAPWPNEVLELARRLGRDISVHVASETRAQRERARSDSFIAAVLGGPMVILQGRAR